jgi:hypothetical protein
MKFLPQSRALSRRQWLRVSSRVGAGAMLAAHAPLRVFSADAPAAIDIGTRRELFVDDLLIASLGGAQLKMQKPEPRDVAITCDAPWEGNTSAYFSIFEDAGKFRMYYRGAHWDEQAKKEAHPELTCYAESADGLAWVKPKLGLHEFRGSRENNIVHAGEATHCFTPFKDTNPACAADARYKAMSGFFRKGLMAYKSPDGLRWSRLAETPVITAGAFDSQNLAFWDAVRGEYRAYWRIFANGVRAIRTATSRDFVRWENQADLKYGDAPHEHLYTNAVQAYRRAPHLFVAFPTRFQPKHQQVEPVFMTSRDAVNFRRWPDALIPITAPKDRDGNRSNYMTWGLLQLPGSERELSVYATEAYYAGPGSRVRRFVFRTDGFVALSAGAAGATVETRALKFRGEKLALNLVSRGNTRVEIVGKGDSKPFAGFAAADCTPIRGDFIEHAVAWKGGSLAALAGKAVRLRFLLEDAELFSMKFGA